MALRVPVAEVQHVPPAARPRRVVVRIGLGRAAEDAAPFGPAAQAVRRVERVPGLVAQDARQPLAAAALDHAEAAALEQPQPRVRHVERDRNARHAVRREPLVRQPGVRLEADPAPLEVRVQALDLGPGAARIEAQAQLTEAQLQQRLVVEVLPSIAALRGHHGSMVP